jgi:ankyrin repeat protein
MNPGRPRGNTFFDAVWRGDLQTIHRLLERGTDVDVVDRNGRTPLIQAAIEGKEEILRLLIGKGSKLDVQDKFGFTALHYAAQGHRFGSAEILLHAGAMVDAPDSHGNTPLWAAIFSSGGRGELIQLLLAYGANKKRKNRYGFSPEDLARCDPRHNVGRFLR